MLPQATRRTARVATCHGKFSLQGCQYSKDAPKQGWPSLKVIDFTTKLDKVGVTVLGVASGKNTRVIVPNGDAVPVEVASKVAEDFVGNLCYIKCVQSACCASAQMMHVLICMVQIAARCADGTSTPPKLP